MKTERLAFWILFADLVCVVTAFIAVQILRHGFTWRVSLRSELPILGIALLFWACLYRIGQLDGFRGGWRFAAVVSHLLLSVCVVAAGLMITSYLTRLRLSNLELFNFGILQMSGFVAIRYFALLCLRHRHRTGKVSRVMIVGSGQIARELATKISRHPEMLCEVAGFLCPQDDSPDAALPGPAFASPISTMSTLEVIDLLRVERIDELVLALARPAWLEVLNLAGRCRELGINVSLVPQPYELYLSRPNLLDLDGLPLLRLQEASTSSLFFFWKRVTDVLLSSIFFVFATIVLVPVAISLRWKNGRAFRWETRCGRHSRRFSMLRLNIDREVGARERFERFLQQVSIAELPQLVNVLRGDMSLVGPRPESVDRVQRYSEWEQQRLSVRPGMTGLAQVHGLRDQHSSEEKTRFDLQYLLNPSPLLDLSLLLQTLWTLAIRLLRYCQPAARSEATDRPRGLELSFPRIEEVLHRAHRSQPSAD